MQWIYLLIAGVFEIVWAVQLKETQGFTKWIPSIVTIFALFLSLYFLALAVKTLPIGLAYVVWTGIGSFGTIVIGLFFFKETFNPVQLLFLINILLSIIGLKLSR